MVDLDYDAQCYCDLCDEHGYCACDVCDEPEPLQLTQRGKTLAITGFLVALGFAGWIEGLA
jgi:hypothetical protein